MNITLVGLGWLGLPLALELQKHNHVVNGFVTTDEKAEDIRAMGIDCLKHVVGSDDEIPASITDATEVLLITIPPLEKDKPEHYGDHLVKLAKQFKNAKHILFTSSTSIYPKKSGIYYERFFFLEREKDASVYQAEHKLQTAFKNRLTIARLAGLIGPGRHPVTKLQGRSDVKNPYGLVNIVHQTDVIRALVLLIDNSALGIFNIVAPEHPTRKDYYTKLYRYHELKQILFVDTPWYDRKISSDKLMAQLGFEYTHSIYDVEDCL
jgi:nucleoside-diphosphate-sugar epimerase